MSLSIVQQKSVQNTSSASSIVATFTSGITSGNIIAALVVNETQGVSITLSDGSSDTPTMAFASPLQDFSVLQGTIGAFFSPTAGTTTVTATFGSAANQQFLTIYEVSGYTAGTTSWDGKSSLASGSATSPLTSGNTATLAQATEAAFGQAWNGSTTTTPVAPWVADNQATSWNVVTAHQLLSSTTAIAFTATFSGTIQYGALVATIKGTIAGGAAVPVLATPRRMYLRRRWAGWRASPLGEMPMRKQRPSLVLPSKHLILPSGYRRAA